MSEHEVDADGLPAGAGIPSEPETPAETPEAALESAEGQEITAAAPEAAQEPASTDEGVVDAVTGFGTDRGGLTDGTSEDDVLEATLGAPTLAAALEAVLLVTDQPIDGASLAALVRRPAADVVDSLETLARDYTEAGRGFDLREVAGGWRFYTRTDCAEIVERYVRDGQQARLTQAALETLAVIAYRQPVTRQRVGAVRGVNVDGVVRTLLARGLVVEAGTDEITGAAVYRTTAHLLERLGLRTLDQLPSLAPLLPELDDLTSDSGST